MKRNVFVCLIFWLVSILAMDVYAQGYVFGPNVRVSDYPPGTAYAYTPNAGQRGVAVRDDTVYCVWSDNRSGDYDVWFSKSTDGGETFLPNVRVDDGAGDAGYSSIAVGDDGAIYVAFDGLKPGFSYIQVYFSKSTDGGLSFTPEVLVNDTVGGIKNHPHRNPSMAVDSAGIIYIGFDDGRNGPPKYDIYFSKSTDGGLTFTQDVMVNDNVIPGDSLDDTRPALALSQGSDIYISWNKEFKWLYVSKSTDGGVNFGSDVQVNDTITESWTNSMDVDSRGYVHIVWTDRRDDNYNIYYSRSVDGGTTFSQDIRVNDLAHEPLPQFYSSMCVDDSGVVYAVWEDGPATEPDIFFTLSTDNEDSAFVEPNVRVNETDSTCWAPSIAVGDSGKVYVLWKDFRNGFPYNDVYFAVGKYESGIEKQQDRRHETTDIRLTIHPNPFSDRVEIRYCIGQSAEGIELKVYDIAGRLVCTLKMSDVCSGTYTVVWGGKNEKNVPVISGVYFVRGRIGKKEVNEKIIYMK